MSEPADDINKELWEALQKPWPWTLALSSHTAPPIVRFYDPVVKAKDARGRSLDLILHWDDEHLERSHDYIQILFPLPEESMFAYNVPILDKATMDAFLRRPELRYRLSLAFHRMLHFYGFKLVHLSELESSETDTDGEHEESEHKGKKKDPEPEAEPLPREPRFFGCVDPKCWANHRIERGSNWAQASRNWAVRMDHNHLRITRILRCLRVLGLHRHCNEFYTALRRVYVLPDCKIGKRSMDFWQRAVELPLYIAPDGERVRWLERWDLREADPSHVTSD